MKSSCITSPRFLWCYYLKDPTQEICIDRVLINKLQALFRFCSFLQCLFSVPGSLLAFGLLRPETVPQSPLSFMALTHFWRAFIDYFYRLSLNFDLSHVFSWSNWGYTFSARIPHRWCCAFLGAVCFLGFIMSVSLTCGWGYPRSCG